MSNLVSIGIIGTGVGVRTLLPGFESCSNCQVSGIVGSSYERSLEFAERHKIRKAYRDYRELCSDGGIDLVCVSSPNDCHYDEVLSAINNDKHVLAEKPLATSMQEVTSLATRASDYRKVTVVDHQLRFNPYFRMIRDLIASEQIGKPYMVSVHQQSTGFSDPSVLYNWSFDAHRGGGVRLAMATHLVDLLHFWFSSDFLSLAATMDTVITERSDANGVRHGVTASSAFAVQAALEDGLTAHLSATAAAFCESRFDVSIFGSSGELHFDLASKLRGALGGQRICAPIEVEGVLPDERANTVSLFKGSFLYFAPRLVSAIADGDWATLSDASTFADAIRNQSVLDAIRAASLSGRSVMLKPGYVPGAEM